MKIVRVRWLDAYRSAEDMSLHEARAFAPDELIEVGFLLVSDERRVVIANSLSKDAGEVRGVLAIPRGMVIDVQELAP